MLCLQTIELSSLAHKMNGFLTPMWPSLLPPVSDTLWFTADCPRFEEGELAQLEEELEQEKQSLKEQGFQFNSSPKHQFFSYFNLRPRMG